MLKVGLTGGIAAGKSTVAYMLRNLDCQVLEADTLGHELLEPGQSAYDEVVREFGNGILGPGDKVDRVKLGAIVFSDASKRAKLNQILHPRILQVVRQWFTSLGRVGGPDLAIFEAALIIEAGFQKELDKLIVCWCNPEQQLSRLMARGMSQEQASLRIASQMPGDQKRALADEVIDCSGSIEDTEKQVAMVFAKLHLAAATSKKG
ncbi:MAG: dephospho-CoA kinase [Candidatus Acidiferrales bacterium]